MLTLTLKSGEEVRVSLSDAFREKITVEDAYHYHETILDPETEIVKRIVPTDDYRLFGELLQPRNDYTKRHYVGWFWAKCEEKKAKFRVDLNVKHADGVCLFEIMDMAINGVMDKYLLDVLNYTLRMIITGNDSVSCLPFVRHCVVVP